jgi:hypothetical protein
LRWRADGPLAARLRPRTSRLYFCLFGAAWNFALGPGHVLELLGAPMHHGGSTLEWVGWVAGAGFLLLAARELALETRVTFRDGKLVVRALLAPWVRFDVPMIEIDGFDVVANRDTTHDVVVVLSAGATRRLPINFETVLFRASWSNRAIFAAPPEYAWFVSVRLSEMLEAARRAGHETYRS